MSQKERLLLIFLVGNLFLGGALLLYLRKKPLCVESSIIKEVVFSHEGQSFPLYSCEENRDVDYVPEIEEKVRALNDRLETPEALLAQIFEVKPFITLHLDKERFEYSADGGNIDMGMLLFQEPLTLELALTKELIQAKSKMRNFEAEILAHLILEIGLPKPAVDKFIVEPPKKLRYWPQAARVWEDYCRFGTLLLNHYSLCRQKQEVKSNSTQYTEYSLLDLWNYVLAEAFKSVDVKKRMEFMRKLPEWFAQWSALDINQKVDSPLFYEDLESLRRAYLRSALGLQGLLTKNGFSNFSEAIYEQNKERGLLSEYVFDFVIVGDAGAISDAEQIAKLERLAFRHPRARMMILRKDGMTIIPGQETVKNSLNDSYKTRRLIMLQCHRPTLSEMLTFKEKTQRLVWVKSCRPNDSYLFTAFVVDGIEAFAKDNLEVPFYSFHLPSIESVLKKNPRADKQTYEQAFGWKAKEWDDMYLAFRVKALVDAVDWFRPEKE